MNVRDLSRRVATMAATGTLAASLVAGMVAAPALAAKPPSGASGTSSIAVVYMDGATAAYYGARVTFTVATTATAYPSASQ